MGRTAIAYSSGSSRAIEPTTLLSGVTPLLASAGITRLANITGLDRIGIPTFSAIRPGASTLSVSAGKGVTVDDARASAAMEALEFFSAEITSFVECCSARDLTRRCGDACQAAGPTQSIPANVQRACIRCHFCRGATRGFTGGGGAGRVCCVENGRYPSRARIAPRASRDHH